MRIETQKIIARNLRTLRTYKGISQVRMAVDLGITKALYSCYELGKSAPDAEFLYDVSRIYGIRMSSLFEENESNFLIAISDCEYYDHDALILRKHYDKLSSFSRGMLIEYCFQMIEREKVIAVNRATFELKHKKTR